MSTAAVHPHHRFSHPVAMAAAATIVVVGGVSAVGVVVSPDDAAAPVAPARASDVCRVTACLPSDIGRDPLGLTHGRHLSPPLEAPQLKGGHSKAGLP
jgi:hypothetical protein